MVRESLIRIKNFPQKHPQQHCELLKALLRPCPLFCPRTQLASTSRPFGHQYNQLLKTMYPGMSFQMDAFNSLSDWPEFR